MESPFLVLTSKGSEDETDKKDSNAKRPEVPKFIQIDKDIITIGRDPAQCDFAFDSPMRKNLLSRTHAQIYRIKGEKFWCIRDMNSTNGTFVNNILRKEKELTDGDEIVFGGGHNLPVGAELNLKDAELRYQFFSGASRKRNYSMASGSSSGGEGSISVTTKTKNTPSAIDSSVSGEFDVKSESQRKHYEILRKERIKAIKAEEAAKEANERLLKTQAERKAADERRKVLEANLKEMETQLQNRGVTAAVKEEITCTICHEVLYRAMISKCEHVFCEKCIAEWLKVSKTCPLCRKKIYKPFPLRVHILDNTIEKMLSELSEPDRRSYIRRKEEEIKGMNSK